MPQAPAVQEIQVSSKPLHGVSLAAAMLLARLAHFKPLFAWNQINSSSFYSEEL